MRPVQIIRLSLAGGIAWMPPALVFGGDGFPAAALGSLESEDYKDRIQAQQDLVTWAQEKPAESMDRLLREHDAAQEPEVRLRLREALLEVVVSEHQRKDGDGYVGIQMSEQVVAVPGDAEQRGGILVTRVQPNTPAMKAGLQMNDVVISLNDIKWPAGMLASSSFSTEIRRHKVGAKVKLGILRGAEVKNIELTLGARPLSADAVRDLMLLRAGAENVTVEEMDQLEKQARATYFDRWLADKRAAARKP